MRSGDSALGGIFRIKMGLTLKSISKATDLNPERRLKPRIYEDFVAKVRGVDITRQRFVEHTIVENLSSSGLYMRLAQKVRPEARLLIILHLLFTTTQQDTELLVAFSGVVLRSEPQPDGAFGVAIRFSKYRFLSSQCSADFFENLVINGNTLPI